MKRNTREAYRNTVHELAYLSKVLGYELEDKEIELILLKDVEEENSRVIAGLRKENRELIAENKELKEQIGAPKD